MADQDDGPWHTVSGKKRGKKNASSSSGRHQNTTPDHANDKGVTLLVNHFPVGYKTSTCIYQHEVIVDCKRSDWFAIRNKLQGEVESNKLCFIPYDRGMNFYSSGEYTPGTNGLTVEVGSKTYAVEVKLKKKICLDKLADSSACEEVLQALNIIIKETSGLGKTFDISNSEQQQKGPIIPLPVLHQTVKYTKQGLSLCADYSYYPFYRSGPVLGYIQQLKIDCTKGLSSEDVESLNKALVGLRVTVTHRDTKQKFTIRKLTDQSASQLTFYDKEDKQLNLEEYFKDVHQKDITHPLLPCLDLSKSNEIQIYVPMEFCEISQGQKCPKEKVPQSVQDKLLMLPRAKPSTRSQKIHDMFEQSATNSRSKIQDQIGLTLDVQMTKVKGQVLAAPELIVGTPPNGQHSKKINIRSDGCQWDFRNSTFLHPEKLSSWRILNFTTNERLGSLDRDVFISTVVNKCRSLGIKIHDRPLPEVSSRMSDLSDYRKLDKLLQKASRGTKGTNVDIIFCPMTAQENGYGTLKCICETKLGIMTQCFLSRKANKTEGGDQFYEYLALKINAKLGGSNMDLGCELPKLAGEHFMLIGADVNHPPPNDAANIKSIAAVVGSITGSSRYAARIRAQEGGCEEIRFIGKMCSELVELYRKTNGYEPKSIIYFRDGVSDGQFDMVRKNEVENIRAQFRSEGYEPKITVIVVKKRHYTRLFPKVGMRNRHGNVLPGTVVDSTIVHKEGDDFYLCSHDGIQGTSKAAHYHKLIDDHAFSPAELQTLAYNLCFTFARCTKPVSLVTPVYYAHLAAYRGRLYYSCDKNSFGNDGRLSMHENILNKMYFL